MLILATISFGHTLLWLLAVLAFVAALAVGVGVRRLSVRHNQLRLKRWVPVAHVSLWASAAVLLVAAVALSGFTTGLLLVVLGLAAVVLLAHRWLRNVVAGLVLFSEADLKRGDRIRVGDYNGEIISIGVRSLQLRDGDGVTHDIPHLELIDRPVSRYSGREDIACELTLEIGDVDDIESVAERMETIAALVPLACPRRRPRAFIDSVARDSRPVSIRLEAFPFSPQVREEYRVDVARKISEQIDAVQ